MSRFSFFHLAPLRALSLIVGLSALLYFWAYSQLELIRYETGRYELSDFAYHLQILSYFWLNEAGDIYSPEYQSRALSALRGPTSGAMPIGLLPSFVVIFLPFAAIAQLDFKLAQSLWLGLSLFLLLAGLRTFLISAGIKPTRISVILPLLLTFLTVPVIRTIALGQTSLFAAGALILLSTPNQSGQRSWIKDSLLLFGLSLKAPYFLLGALLVLSFRNYRALTAACLLILLSAGLLTTLSGTDSLSSFITTQRSYQEGVFPPIYSQTTSQPDSTVFANSFTTFIEPSVGRRLSFCIFALTFCCALVFVILNKRRKLLLYLSLCVYLLFSPYAGVYENALIFSALPLTSTHINKVTPFYISLLYLLVCGLGRSSPELSWLVLVGLLAVLESTGARGNEA